MTNIVLNVHADATTRGGLHSSWCIACKYHLTPLSLNSATVYNLSCWQPHLQTTFWFKHYARRSNIISALRDVSSINVLSSDACWWDCMSSMTYFILWHFTKSTQHWTQIYWFSVIVIHQKYNKATNDLMLTIRMVSPMCTDVLFSITNGIFWSKTQNVFIHT